jgi:hypothetical protein
LAVAVPAPIRPTVSRMEDEMPIEVLPLREWFDMQASKCTL